MISMGMVNLGKSYSLSFYRESGVPEPEAVRRAFHNRTDKAQRYPPMALKRQDREI